MELTFKWCNVGFDSDILVVQLEVKLLFNMI